MYNIYSIVIRILFDIPRFSVNDLHQIQVDAPSPSSRKKDWTCIKHYVTHTAHTEQLPLRKDTFGCCAICVHLILPCLLEETISTFGPNAVMPMPGEVQGTAQEVNVEPVVDSLSDSFDR